MEMQLEILQDLHGKDFGGRGGGLEPASTRTSMKEVYRRRLKACGARAVKCLKPILMDFQNVSVSLGGELSLQEDGGGDRVHSRNPPGFAGHDRHGGPYYKTQHASVSSSPQAPPGRRGIRFK